MFNKIKEFFTGSKPAVEATQEVPLTAVDVAVKNIKETTAAVDAKVEVAEAAPQQAWTKNSPAPIATTTRKKPQTTKAPATTAPRKRKPAPK